MKTTNTPQTHPEPVLKKWTLEATITETINGAARDLAELISLLIARQRMAVGFEADHLTIQLVAQLTRALCDLSGIVNQSAPSPVPKKRGRPSKPRYVNPELLHRM